MWTYRDELRISRCPTAHATSPCRRSIYLPIESSREFELGDACTAGRYTIERVRWLIRPWPAVFGIPNWMPHLSNLASPISSHLIIAVPTSAMATSEHDYMIGNAQPSDLSLAHRPGPGTSLANRTSPPGVRHPNREKSIATYIYLAIRSIVPVLLRAVP
jgi:hypothetical protein